MDTLVAQRASGLVSFPKGYQRWLLFVLMLVCTINYADHSVVASVVELLRRDLGLTDFQLELLQGLSFALLYLVLGIPFARLAERRNCVRIIAAATFIWSLMTALCGATAAYLQLLMVRVGVGVGEAGFMSPASSILGDHFRRGRRAYATSIMMFGVPVGALVGAVSGGFIAEHLGWHAAFAIMGLLVLFVAFLMWFTLRDPHDAGARHAGARARLRYALMRSTVFYAWGGLDYLRETPPPAEIMRLATHG